MVLFSLVLEGDKEQEEYRKCLILARKYGFYSFQIYEHISYRPAWSILFQIAKAEGTRGKIAIGPVTVPVQLFHPFYMAANVAALCDALVGGKVVLGISRGAFYEFLGVPRYEKPITAVKEAVEIVDTILKEKSTRYNGKVFTFSGGLKWKFKPNYEIYVGSSGPKMIEIASGMTQVKGIVVDNLWSPTYAAKIKSIIELRRAHIAKEKTGDFQLIARPFCVIVSKENKEATTLGVNEVAKYFPFLLKGSPMVKELGLSDEELQVVLRDYLTSKSAKERVNTVIESFAAIGTPAQIIEQTDRMIKSGVSHICYGHPLGPELEEGIKLIGQKVKPYFDQKSYQENL